ncbi:hypothetical protein [Gracilimonas sp.]|nr:hypothetical protein [Gracilimonas sp.]
MTKQSRRIELGKLKRIAIESRLPRSVFVSLIALLAEEDGFL